MRGLAMLAPNTDASASLTAVKDLLYHHVIILNDMGVHHVSHCATLGEMKIHDR